MVNVYDEQDNIIAQVESNNNLDIWDGSNYTCGETGRHKGLTRLKDGRFVLIRTSQWTGEQDFARVISPEEAVQEILRSGSTNLFSKWPELNKIADDSLIEEG